MESLISFEKVWIDNGSDLMELKITLSNKTSQFSTKIYSSLNQIEKLETELNNFQTNIHSGEKFEIKVGEFGATYASGAFSANIEVQTTGKLYITTHIQSEFSERNSKKIADEMYLFMISEPALLQNFVKELAVLKGDVGSVATLLCTS